MPRRREVKKRDIQPDPMYKDVLVAKFINGILRKGKKSVAERIFYNSLEIIKGKAKDDPLKVFKQAVENVRPVLEVKPRRVGGATYQVPVEVRSDRRTSLAIRWIIQLSKTRQEKTMQERLASELLEAANNKGAVIKKKEDTHRMAEANKAFAHYRW
jgi:small subunit ribosomal protein S7